ncbi:MAG: c-type cytochrome [Nitrospiraceae bacterium]
MVVLLLAMWSSGLAWSAEPPSALRPFWTEQAMFRVGDDLFFVGVKSCAPTSEEGRRQAFEGGMREVRSYAQGRDVSRLLVETQMIYEEPNALGCPARTSSVWRLLRVSEARIAVLPRLTPGPPGDGGSERSPKESAKQPPSRKGENRASKENNSTDVTPAVPPNTEALAPRIAFSREEIVQRFGKPLNVKKQGREEIWEYPNKGLTITFGRDETLLNWALTGKPDRPSQSAETLALAPSLKVPLERPQNESPREPPPLPPAPSPDPIVEGRMLFNGKGACNTCHGRDADMFTDVKQETLFGVAPGYLPPVFTPFAGPSPRRVPPNLRDWFALRIRTDLELARAIKDGIAGSAMTGTRHLTDPEISSIIAYLNSLR